MTENQQKNPEGVDMVARITTLETNCENLFYRVKDIEDAIRFVDEALEEIGFDDDGIDANEHDNFLEENEEYIDDFDPELDRAWDALVDEAKRRHTLAVEIFNSTMQRIGFLLAFTPILFVEAVNNIHDATDIMSYGPAILLALCFVSGVVAIVVWWAPSFGVYTDDLISSYNKMEWVGVQENILRGAVDGSYAILDRTASIRAIMNVMVLSLLFGSAALMFEMLEIRLFMEIIFLFGLGIVLGYSYGEVRNRLSKKNKLMPSDDDKGDT